jgi:hypothetical protein
MKLFQDSEISPVKGSKGSEYGKKQAIRGDIESA